MNREQILAQAKKLILKADYRKAMLLLERLRKLEFDDFETDFMYAKLLGDYADELPQAKQTVMKKQSVQILSKLIRQMNGKSFDLRFGVRLNYYYQTRRFADLERVGRSIGRENRLKGVYASGVGASLEAERLATHGRTQNLVRAKKFASRAIRYWEQYFDLNRKEVYYFPYTLLAMGAAIAGSEAKMDKALKSAAKLSGRTADYWEFAVIRKLYRK